MAVGTFAAANAHAADLTTGSNVIFASSGGQTSANVANAKANDNVDITTNGVTLTVENNGVSNDGSGTNTFNVGAVTNSGAGVSGNLTVQNGLNPSTSAAVVADFTANFASVNLGGNVLIANRDADNSANATTFTGASKIGGTLNVTNNESSAAKVVSLDVNSDLEVTGATTLTGGSTAGSNATLNVFGNATFTGGLTLDDGTGTTTLTLDGTSAQTVAGAINGGAATNEGTIVVANSAGVTFTGIIGATSVNTITISNGTSNSSATFTKSVSADTAITLGNNSGTDTNTVTFDATGGNTVITGSIKAASAGETANVVIAGGSGKSVTLATATGTGANALDTVTVQGGTKLIANSINATDITLANGATLNSGAGTPTYTANINGAGTLDVDVTTTVDGNIGNSTALTAIDVANVTLTIDDTASTAGNANTTVSASAITLNGASSTLSLDAANNKTVTVTGPITTATTAQGIISVVGDGAAESFVFANDIGTSTKSLATITAAPNANGSNLTFAGNVFADALIADNAADVFTFTGNGVTVSGTFNGTGNGEGDIIVGDGTNTANVTFGGIVGGTGDANLFQVNTKGTANVSKNIEVTGANAGLGVNIDGTLNVSSATGTVLVDAVDGNFDIDGTVAVTGANSVNFAANDTFSVDGTLTSVLSGTAKTLTLTSDANTLTVGTVLDTTVSTQNQIILGSTAATIGANGRVNSLTFAATSDFNPDTTTVVDGSAATVTFAAGSVLNVSAANGGRLIDNGATVTVLTTGGGTDITTALGDGRIVLADSGLIDLSDDTSTATALKVKVAYRDANAVFTGDDTVGGGAANSLMNFPGATGELQTIRNSLGTANATHAQEIAEAASPTVDGGNVVAAMDVTTNVFGVASTRLASLKGNQSGMAAGSMPVGSHTWGQVFGQSANQDKHDGVDGYDSRTGGVAIGADAEAMDGSGHLGAALSYANTNVDSDNANNTETDIDSYQITAYGDMDLQNDLYLSGMAAYAFNDNNTTRHNVGGIAGLTADGDFNAHQFAARAELGRPYAMEGGLVLTPSVMADYMYYNAEDFTETGAGTANLNVDQDSVNRLDLGVGIDAGWTFQNADGSFLKPSVNAGYRYDVIGDDISSTSSFTGGGAAFETNGLDPEQSRFNIGGAVKYMTVNNWDFTAQYDYQFSSDYDSHNGLLRAAYKF